MTTTAIRTPPAAPARRRRRRRGRTAVAVLLLLAVVVVLGGLTLTADAPLRPDTVPVVRGGVVVQAHVDGSVVSRVATAAAFPVDGVVAGVDATVGATVRTGDVLATLDDSAVRPGVAAAEAALAADERARDAAAAVPVPDPVALARLDAAISADRAALAEARRVLDGGVLRAAQDGTVTVVRAQVGDRVSAASPPAVEIADLTGLVVRVAVAPAQVADVVVGRTASVTTGGPRLRGQVVDVAPVPGPDGRYAVAIGAPLPDTARIGLPAQASIVLARRDGVLVVPPDALRPGPTPGTATVQVVRGQGPVGSGGTVARTVEVGLVGDDAVEVVDGLAVGDEVVVGGTGLPAAGS
ncbi:efflux RND transporter periplasmic adaptor subunit [Actinomycetospora soli]|uniref:efflux RND transporter periplasmic adaptor subunit n=1 Tax=Actinomycetospora soli TaxID=2893887 RepID=UPI001E577B04|nr:HlyD family efflux transporter periplasmic adaptor subunit [Actinomycetospora soli]MCD2191202.1 HlyD family efflux transporter periplasmic adaptor subunit [Actinomycetospora soli]